MRSVISLPWKPHVLFMFFLENSADEDFIMKFHLLSEKQCCGKNVGLNKFNDMLTCYLFDKLSKIFNRFSFLR